MYNYNNGNPNQINPFGLENQEDEVSDEETMSFEQ